MVLLTLPCVCQAYIPLSAVITKCHRHHHVCAVSGGRVPAEKIGGPGPARAVLINMRSGRPGEHFTTHQVSEQLTTHYAHLPAHESKLTQPVCDWNHGRSTRHT